MYRASEEIVQQVADNYARYAGDERYGPDDGYAIAADELLAWPGVQAAIRAAQAEAVREAAATGSSGYDLTPTLSTLNGQNAFWWYDYLKGLDRLWRSRLEAQAKRYERD